MKRLKPLDLGPFARLVPMEDQPTPDLKRWPKTARAEYVEGFAVVDEPHNALRGWIERPRDAAGRWFYFRAGASSSSASWPTLPEAVAELVPSRASDRALSARVAKLQRDFMAARFGDAPANVAPKRKTQAEPIGETIPQKRRRLRAEARAKQQTIIPELRAAIRDLKRARSQRAAHCKRLAKRRQQRIAALAKKAERDLAARVAKLKERARETAKACNLRDLDRLDQLLAELASEQQAIKALRDEARGLKSTRGQAGGKRAAEKRAEALDAVRRDVADDPILLALWEKHGRKIKQLPRATLTESFLQWVHDNPQAIDEMQREQERAYEDEARAMLAQAREAHREPDTCQSRLRECEKWLREVAPEGMSATDVPF